MESIIHIKNLEKSFKQVSGEPLNVLNNLDFFVSKGDFISIIGHSGSGKSTFLHMLGLLDMPCSFESLKICDVEISELSLEDRAIFRGKNLGFIFQFHQLLPEFTALQNVILPMQLHGTKRTVAKNRAMELFSMVFSKEEMNNKVYARRESQLSGGQCQRVAIARALANDPPIVYADEPTGSLDPVSTEIVMDILKQLPENGTTVIMITHQMELANQADKVYKLSEGKLVDHNILDSLEIDAPSFVPKVCKVCNTSYS